MAQTDPMDALDDKLNGAPVMEIDEPVSVRDRTRLLFVTTRAFLT